MDDHTEIICWNPLAAALLGCELDLSKSPKCMARLLFLDPLTAARHLDWDTAARDTVGILRMAAGRDPLDSELAALIGELSLRSDAFRQLWASHHVYEKTHGAKVLHHPEIGDIHLDYESFRVPGPEHDTLVLYTPAPGSPSQDSLTLLARLISDSNDGDLAAGGRPSLPEDRPATARESWDPARDPRRAMSPEKRRHGQTGLSARRRAAPRADACDAIPRRYEADEMARSQCCAEPTP